jgi:DNA polymerase-1
LKKYILVDSNNLGVRNAFANPDLINDDGIPTGVHFGVFQSLFGIKDLYPDYEMLMVWDGKSSRRMKESQEGVDKGIIPEAYKMNRKKEPMRKELTDFYAQAPYLKKAIDKMGVPQIKLNDFEADDVVSSYCKKLKQDNEVICLTSDFDYLQLLDTSVSIYDGMKKKLITLDSFKSEYGIEPKQWIDIGSLTGDTGDNIFGVNGVGETTALKAIKEFGSWVKVMDAYKTQLASFRNQYPDLSSNPVEFNRLQDIQTPSKKPKYPEITINMPFTGVALAIEDKKIKDKIPKTTLMTVMFEERVKLAYSLKKMDDDIADLPDIVQGQVDKEKLKEYFQYYQIYSLMDSVDKL